MKKLLLLAVICWAPVIFANTPGKHSVSLAWGASPTAGVTYNIYRGNATGVCSGTPTPYQTGITQLFFLDSTVANGSTDFYAISAVGTGGESTCTSEVQVQIPNPAQAPPTPTATVN